MDKIKKIKNIIRKVLVFIHADITKNLKYDRLTKQIIINNLKINSNCIDIGCHKGEILDLVLKYSPRGKHYAFEPIPHLFNELSKKYGDNVRIFPYALSDKIEQKKFYLVKNALAYSGLKKRRYDIENPEIEEINVESTTLDDVIAINEKIDFIKIDVEGGEFGVMKGAKKLLIKNKPLIVFECGKGASDYYGTIPIDIYNFITLDLEMKIFTLKSFLKNKESLNFSEFENFFNTNKEYYFVASNK